MKIILTLTLMVLMTLQTLGENPADSVKVYFRVGQSVYDPALRNNRMVMDSFVKIVCKAFAENNIEHIEVSGYASPDGTSSANDRLSQLRCEAIAAYISEHTGIKRDFIRTVAEGIAWDELRQMVADNPDVPSRDKILDILDNTPVWVFGTHGKIIDGRKAQLMSLDRGEPYRWMLKHLFPELRNAVGIAVFYKDIRQPLTNIPDIIEETRTAQDTIKPETPDYLETNIIEMSEESEASDIQDLSDLLDFSPITATNRRKSYLAVKTNMLFDAALIPNLGAEFYLGKNISIFGEWMYAWWDNNRRHRYWRTYGGDAGLRWWFGKKAHTKPLTGHHLGVYGGIFIFDFEMGDTGYMGGKPGGTLWDRYMLNTGIEYGYSVPIGSRLNIDFSIGIGYFGGNYIKYFPFDNDYYREKEYRLRFFGPTKAEISLIWLIGRGNTNNRKGGEE